MSIEYIITFQESIKNVTDSAEVLWIENVEAIHLHKTGYYIRHSQISPEMYSLHKRHTNIIMVLKTQGFCYPLPFLN